VKDIRRKGSLKRLTMVQFKGFGLCFGQCPNVDRVTFLKTGDRFFLRWKWDEQKSRNPLNPMKTTDLFFERLRCNQLKIKENVPDTREDYCSFQYKEVNF
jgi:hypothetical protein